MTQVAGKTVLADELEAKLREVEAILRQASDAQWRAVCALEAWPVGLVAFHLALTFPSSDPEVLTREIDAFVAEVGPLV